MAAGQGFKTFVTGEVLTAGDVNGYLMQGINVFANATARDAAITVPAEGQFAFTKDNNSLWYYDGAAWVASGATGDIEGVTAGVGISGGGTSGTVTITNSMATAITTNGDLIYGTGSGTFTRRGIGSTGQVLTVSGGIPTWATPSAGISSWSLKSTLSGSGASALTATGLNSKAYLILFQGLSSAAYSDFDITFNSDTTNNYAFLYARQYGASSYSSSVFTATGSVSDPRIRTGSTSASQTSSMSGGLTITEADTTGLKPFISNFGINAQGGADAMSQSGQGFYAGTSAITSITITSTGGNFDGGTIYIYGGN